MLVGQAQKEFFVNQALSLLDGMIGRTVVCALTAPPQAAQDGACYRIAAPATGNWAGREDQLAIAIGGDWHFITPEQGFLVFDRGLGQFVIYDGMWQTAGLPAAATGGAVVDAEARALLAQVIDALAKLGLVASTPA